MIATSPWGARVDGVLKAKLMDGPDLPWADLSARFSDRDQSSGAALFVAADHPDFPPEWLTRHYGVLCLGWPGVTPRGIRPGEPIRCRYRVWIHRGTPGEERTRRAYRACEPKEP